MFEVHEITIKEAFGFDSKKPLYRYFGVFLNTKLVATQVVSFKDDIYFLSLDKETGTPHGVFKAVLDYFENLYKGKNVYLDVYVPKLQKMYENYGFHKVYEHTLVKQL